MDISLIIPAYNEGADIRETIRENRRTLKDIQYEIIVVNDGSTDKTKAIVERIISWDESKRIRLINLPINKGKCNALNVGIDQSKGDLVVCSDADSYLDKDAYPKILQDFKEHENVIAVVGLIAPYNNKKLISKLQEVEYLFEQKVLRDVQYKWKNVIGIPGPFFAFRHDDITKLKNGNGKIFNDSIVEDFELAVRLNKRKLKMCPTSKILARTKVPETLKVLRKQRLRWFGGTLYETLKHKAWKINPFYGVNLLMMFIAPIFLGLVAIQICVTTHLMGGILVPLVGSFFLINTMMGGVHAICVKKHYLMTIFIFPLYLILIYLLRVESVLHVTLGKKFNWGK